MELEQSESCPCAPPKNFAFNRLLQERLGRPAQGFPEPRHTQIYPQTRHNLKPLNSRRPKSELQGRRLAHVHMLQALTGREISERFETSPKDGCRRTVRATFGERRISKRRTLVRGLVRPRQCKVRDHECKESADKSVLRMARDLLFRTLLGKSGGRVHMLRSVFLS